MDGIVAAYGHRVMPMHPSADGSTTETKESLTLRTAKNDDDDNATDDDEQMEIQDADSPRNCAEVRHVNGITSSHWIYAPKVQGLTSAWDLQEQDRMDICERGGWVAKKGGGADGASGSDADDDDSYSVNSDWDEEETVQRLLPGYLQYAKELKSGEWNNEQRKVHKLLYMRGEHPLLARTWMYNFLDWGINPEIYSTMGSRKRLAIKALGGHYRAEKALVGLFELSTTVKLAEDLDQRAKIPSKIVKAISAFLKWAEKDAGVDGLIFPPMVIAKTYSLGFKERGPKIKLENTSDEAFAHVDLESIAHVNDGGNEDKCASFDGGGAGRILVMSDSDQTGHMKQTVEDEDAEIIEAVSRDIERRLRELAERQRIAHDGARTATGEPLPPPTLYAFAVVEHVVMLISLDSASQDSKVVVLDAIRFSDIEQWLWNALSVALPVNMVRDAMHARKGLMRRPSKACIDLTDDPDL